MFGHSRFRWLHGYYSIRSVSSTDLPLSEADADIGTLYPGHLLDYDDANYPLMEMKTGKAFCLLWDSINLSGTTNAEGFRNFSTGSQFIPKKRGQPISALVWEPGGEAEFEGTGVAAVGNLVCASGTGSLAAASFDDLVSCHKGGLREAQTGEWAIARVLSRPTAENSGETRVRIQFMQPHIVPAA